MVIKDKVARNFWADEHTTKIQRQLIYQMAVMRPFN